MTNSKSNSPEILNQIAILDEQWKKKERHFKAYGANKEKFNSIMKITSVLFIITAINMFMSSSPLTKYIGIAFMIISPLTLIYRYKKLQKFTAEEMDYENTRKDLLTKVSK